jgi:putative ABC transport system permease protein
MIKNYIKIAWRNLIKHKLYSFINIVGLATGLAVCMLIMLYVAHEMSYDRFHKNANRIFSAHYISKLNDSFYGDDIKYDSGAEIKRSQPSVEAYMGVMEYYSPVIISKPLSLSNKLSESGLIFADAGFFNFFSFNLLTGRGDNVLKAPFSIVLSKDMAEKYFGSQNPVGKTITLKTDSAYTYKVTGVAENCPSNSSIKFNFLASGSSLLSMKEFKERLYGSTYLLLKHTADTASLRRSMQLGVQKKFANMSDMKGIQFELVSLPDTNLKDFLQSPNKISYLTIFPLIAALILLLALVNYMSLSTARATVRAKEIGVRKVAGADRKTLAAQFYVESALFACLSFILGYMLFYIFQPWFLHVLQLKIDSSFLYSPLVLLLMFALLIVIILLAGSYPALMLSALKPVVTLKGKTDKAAGGTILRKVFTIIQFTIAVTLIICGIVINCQLYFFRHTDTGLNRENVVMVPFTNSLGKGYEPFKHEIQSMAAVSSVAASRASIFESYMLTMVQDKTSNSSVLVNQFSVDTHFIPLLNLKWKIKPDEHTDITSGNKVLINEKAIEKLHLKPDPVGTVIAMPVEKFTIAGVLKNFNFTTLAKNIDPLAVFVMRDSAAMWNKNNCNLYVKIKAHTNLPTLIGNIETIYKKYDHETPFSYSFMDDRFNQQYHREDKLAALFSLFTGIAIVLATLGLFGLAAFTIEQRIKEIGIRKVLGASTASVNLLLSVDFLKLVLLAIIIASPIAWWIMDKWLQSFAYRITVPWWGFIMAGLIAIITSVITVSYNAIKAALANPVKSLRSE